MDFVKKKDFDSDFILNLNYDLEIESIILEINSNNYLDVILQFPDGLKQFAKVVVDKLNKKTKANIYIYFGTCFGACDVPLYLKNMDFDYLVSFGHSKFLKEKKKIW